jgi:hypothetical protein
MRMMGWPAVLLLWAAAAMPTVSFAQLRVSTAQAQQAEVAGA